VGRWTVITVGGARRLLQLDRAVRDVALSIATHMVRRAALILAATGTAALTACSGSTEPASDVTFSGATLNARGTANNGPAYSFFEFWVSGFPTKLRQSDYSHWPAGASGPFSAKVGSLYSHTTYSFRLCGQDEGGGLPVCAQTRSFTTPVAPRDAVKGSWFAYSSSLSPFGRIDATAGPPGQPPSGSVEYKPANLNDRFTGFVTCLVVSGERAAVGAVGQYRDATTGATRAATTLVTVIENEPEFSDLIRVVLTFGSTPPACASATYPTSDDSVNPNDLVVYDAP
jgi:hypothetical protein